MTRISSVSWRVGLLALALTSGPGVLWFDREAPSVVVPLARTQAPVAAAPEIKAHPLAQPESPVTREAIQSVELLPQEAPSDDAIARVEALEAATVIAQGTFHQEFDHLGVLEESGTLVDGKREGVWHDFAPNGARILKTEYRAGKAAGSITAWNENGSLRSRGFCADGKFDGRCALWMPGGTLDLEQTGFYVHGERIAP